MICTLKKGVQIKKTKKETDEAEEVKKSDIENVSRSNGPRTVHGHRAPAHRLSEKAPAIVPFTSTVEQIRAKNCVKQMIEESKDYGQNHSPVIRINVSNKKETIRSQSETKEMDIDDRDVKKWKIWRMKKDADAASTGSWVSNY